MFTLQQIKERRFTTTARILTGKHINTHIVEQPQGAPAWTDCTSGIWMNEARPQVADEQEALIYDRGKLFHEINHCVFHGKQATKHREKLLQSANDEDTFLNISNALMDGHGEYHGGLKWEGQKSYIM